MEIRSLKSEQPLKCIGSCLLLNMFVVRIIFFMLSEMLKQHDNSKFLLKYNSTRINVLSYVVENSLIFMCDF
jgi:hypothetical protein